MDNEQILGQFKNGNFHGQGALYCANGDKYTGGWVEDKKSGHGVFIWFTGDRYEGQYKDDMRNGKGIYYYATGNRYRGDWIDGKMTGHGVFVWSTGDRYEMRCSPMSRHHSL